MDCLYRDLYQNYQWLCIHLFMNNWLYCDLYQSYQQLCVHVFMDCLYCDLYQSCCINDSVHMYSWTECVVICIKNVNDCVFMSTNVNVIHIVELCRVWWISAGKKGKCRTEPKCICVTREYSVLGRFCAFVVWAVRHMFMNTVTAILEYPAPCGITHPSFTLSTYPTPL